MAHLEQYAFVTRVFRMFHPLFTAARVLGVGTRDINSKASGYDVEALFTRCELTGLDLEPGPGVTHICHVADWDTEASHGYDVVYSCEALEHDRRWTESLRQMVRLVRPGGLMFVTCGGPGREEHGTLQNAPHASPSTTDYYGNLSLSDLDSAIAARDNFRWYAYEEFLPHHDSYFWGIRR